MRNRVYTVGVAIILLAGRSAALAQSTSQKQKLTIEQLIDIKHPSDPIWSPDGKGVAFVWDRAGVANLYIANADGAGTPKPLTMFSEGQVNGAFWSADGDIVYFPHDGDLWQVAATGGAAKPVWNKPDPGSGYVPAPDGKRVAFVRGNRAAAQDAPHGSDLIIRWLSDGTESTTAHDDVSIRGVLWSPDGASVAYTAGSKIIHHDESPSYSGAKLIYRVSEYVPGQIYAIKLAEAKPIAIAKPGKYGGLAWVDNTHLVFDGQSADFKNYFIYLADAATGNTKTIHEIHEEKFWSIPDPTGAKPARNPGLLRMASGSPSSAIKTAGIISTSCPHPAATPSKSQRGNLKLGVPLGRTTARASLLTPTSRADPAIASWASQKSAMIPRTPKSLIFLRNQAQISSRTGRKATAASSINTPTRGTAPIFTRSDRTLARHPCV